MPYAVGSVPFLNAKPLVWAFERIGEESPVRVTYDWPSRLPGLLDSGLSDAVLVSSIDALTVPDRAIAGGSSISSRGPVKSVKLFSKVPFSEISTLALDSSSLTSNALARLVLSLMFRCEPVCSHEVPDGDQMLSRHDACVLIGDKGLLFEGSGLFQLDLGEAWTNLTGMPFVWACWVGKENLTPELAGLLCSAREIGQMNLASVASGSPAEISPQLAHDYLTTVFDYRLEQDQLMGLQKFGELLTASGLVPTTYEPAIVDPDTNTRLDIGQTLATATLR